MTDTLSQPKNWFKTKDLYEASALYAVKTPILAIERDGKQCWFVFDKPEDCRKNANSYWQGELVVNAKDFADAIRTLKDRIFAQQWTTP